MTEAGGFDKLVDKAKEAAKRRNYDYAIDLLFQVLKLNPDHEEAARQIRAVTIRKGQEEGTSTKSGLFKGLGSLMKSGMKEITKNFEHHIVECENFLRTSPFDVKVMVRLGNAALQAGHLHRALANFETASEIDKKNVDAMKSLGRIYRELGDMRKAALFYDKVLAISPYDAESAKARKDIAASTAVSTIESMGESYRDKLRSAGEAVKLEIEGHIIRSKEDALRVIEAKKVDIQKKPRDSKLYREVGDLYIKAEDLVASEEYYNKAIEVNPKDLAAMDKLGELQLKKMDIKILELSTAYREGPSEDRRLALETARKERLIYQIREYERRLEQHPTDTELRFKMGKLLFQVDEDDRAIGELQKTVHDPKNATEAHSLIGLSFRKKGMYELALKEMYKARERLSIMNDTNKEITYELAKTFELMGKKTEAKMEYQKIAEVDYTYKDVASRLTQL